MDLKHSPLDLPVSESKNLGKGRLITNFKKDELAKLLLKNLAVMQANEMLTDMTVCTKSRDHEEPFHSMLLAACSPVIRRILTGKHFDCTAGAFSLGDLTPRLLKAFRDFLYKSKLPSDVGMVYELRRFANRYGIVSLEQLCGLRRDQREGDEGMAVWSKHHEDVLSQLQDMFQKTQLATTVLEGSERSTQFAVHGPLIAAATPVLQHILSQEGAKHRLEEVTCNTLEDLIEFIYTGEVTLEGENVVELLHAACFYEIPALARASCGWLGLYLNPYNAIGIWKLTRKENSEFTSDLEEDAKGCITANFTSVCKDEFGELDYEDLKEIIQDDNLCVQDEEDVFSAVVIWVEADEDGRSSFFCDLLHCVRLEYTSLEFLHNLKQDPLVSNCSRCLQTVQSAQAKAQAQEHIEWKAFDRDEQLDDFEHGNIPEIAPRSYEDEDVRRALLREFLESQAVTSTQKSDDGLEEMTKRTPRRGQRKNGELDMRLSNNRRRLGLQNKDGSPDMRFKVNKKAFGRHPSQGQKDVPATQSPLTKHGKPDMRFKVNKEAYNKPSSQKSTRNGPVKKDGTPDMRYAANKTPTPKTPSSGNASTPVKRDGTPDMRFAVNRPPRRPASTQTRSPSSYAGPLKKDGTPDMRFAVNRPPRGPISTQTRSPSSFAGPLKKDGTPDMRYAENKQSVLSSSSSSYEASLKSQQLSYSTPSGPAKKDGTPDMRYAANKSPYNSPLSSGYSSYGSPYSATSLTSGLGSPGPLKNDGTPDMRYASNRSSYGSSSSYGGSSSSSSSSGGGYSGASSCGPLKSNGTPDMRYASNRSSYGSSSSYGGSSSSSSSGGGYGGASSCGPLKSNGTPDMRYAANRSSYGSSSSYGGSSSSSSSSGGGYGGGSSCGPLKSNGTPDMRYAANRSSYSSSSSYGGSSYSSRSSSSGGGYGGSCGPLKSNGTPDMRYSANRR